MCQTVFLSTNSPQDLTQLELPVIGFTKELWKEDFLPLLKYPNQYMIIQKDESCSCFARNIPSDLGFVGAVDWMNEEESDKDLQSTFLIHDVIKDLVNKGFEVDAISSWTENSLACISKPIIVHINEIPRNHFTFFDNTYFQYVK